MLNKVKSKLILMVNGMDKTMDKIKSIFLLCLCRLQLKFIPGFADISEKPVTGTHRRLFLKTIGTTGYFQQ